MAIISTNPHAHRSFSALALLRTLGESITLRKQRKALKSLDDTRLNDLGISRAEAMREARRPVWDVPNNWLR